MKYLVLGAGMMDGGRIRPCQKQPDNEVVMADINIQTAKRSAAAIGANVTL